MADTIQQMRRQAGVSQSELARLSHVSQPNLSAYEAGKRTPRPETLERIMRALKRRPSEILFENRQQVLDAAVRNRASNVRVFGSSIRGEDTVDSDIDLLVDLDPGASLFDLSGLRADLIELLGVDVDVIQSGAAGVAMDHITSEAIPL